MMIARFRLSASWRARLIPCLSFVLFAVLLSGAASGWDVAGSGHGEDLIGPPTLPTAVTPVTFDESPPSADPTTSGDAATAGFDLIVYPGEDGFPGASFVGERIKLLVVIKPTADTWQGSARITAAAPGARVQVEPARLGPGVVGEVTVIPGITWVEKTFTVTITATHRGATITRTRSIGVVPEIDLLTEEAATLRDLFIPWIERRYPEFGINAQTEWVNTIARPHWLIVSHYTFYSEDWEMGMEWHVMIAPDDWCRIYLRHRWSATAPSFAAEISSVSLATAPYEITPPAEIIR